MSTITFTSLAHSFSYALLYSIWQGLLVYGLVFMLLKAIPHLNSRFKYSLSLSALATLTIWFSDTWVSQYNKLKGVTVYISQTAAEGSGVNFVRPYVVNTDASAHFDIFRDYLPLISKYVPFIIAVYCIGLAFMVFRFSLNLARLRPLATTATSEAPPQWKEFVHHWQLILGISRPVKLLLSHKVNVPMMLGALKPVILLPVSVVNNLTTQQVEAILMHELAHIRRHDYLINLIQTLVETVLFFNPFVWLISSVIRREREHCCDDLVLSCAADPMHYAQALTLIEDDRINNLSLAATGNRNQLFNRIKRIMEMKKENIAQRRYSLLIVAVVATIFMASIVTFTPSFAQKTKTEKIKEKETDKKGEPQKVTTTKTVTKDGAGKKKVITKTVSTNADSDDDAQASNVRVKILVDDDDKHHHHHHYHHGGNTAKVVVVDDGKEGKRKRKEIIIAKGGNASAHTIVIDGDKIEREIEHAMKEIENIDWDAIGDGIEDALSNIKVDMNLDNLDKQVRIEIKKELEKSREALEGAKREIERSKRDIEHSRAMARAHAGHTRAHAHAGSNGEEPTEQEIMVEGENVSELLDKLHKDGLIDRTDKFKVEKREGELYINGEKQSAAVMEKYNRYLKGRDVIIKGSRDNLNVNVTN